MLATAPVFLFLSLLCLSNALPHQTNRPLPQQAKQEIPQQTEHYQRIATQPLLASNANQPIHIIQPFHATQAHTQRNKPSGGRQETQGWMPLHTGSPIHSGEDSHSHENPTQMHHARPSSRCNTLRRRLGALWRMLRENQALVLPGLVMFCFYATPSASGQFAAYQYNVYATDQCTLVRLQMLSAGATGFGCVLYGFVLSKYLSFQLVFVLSGICTVLASLLNLPLTARPSLTAQVHLAKLHMEHTSYFYLVTFIGGLVSPWSILPLMTLASDSCPKTKRGLLYAVYLSSIDLGNSVGEWATTPIIKALDITYTNYGSGYFRGLSLLLIICGACRLGSLVISVPVLLHANSVTNKNPRGRDDSGLQDEKDDQGHQDYQDHQDHQDDCGELDDRKQMLSAYKSELESPLISLTVASELLPAADVKQRSNSTKL